MVSLIHGLHLTQHAVLRIQNIKYGGKAYGGSCSLAGSIGSNYETCPYGTKRNRWFLLDCFSTA